MQTSELDAGWLIAIAQDCEAKGVCLLAEIDRWTSEINEVFDAAPHGWYFKRLMGDQTLERLRWLRGEVESRPDDLTGIERDDRERSAREYAAAQEQTANFVREFQEAHRTLSKFSMDRREVSPAPPTRVRLGEWAKQATAHWRGR